MKILPPDLLKTLKAIILNHIHFQPQVFIFVLKILIRPIVWAMFHFQIPTFIFELAWKWWRHPVTTPFIKKIWHHHFLSSIPPQESFKTIKLLLTPPCTRRTWQPSLLEYLKDTWCSERVSEEKLNFQSF